MDVRHAIYLVVEALNLSGGSLLGEEAGAVRAELVALGEQVGDARLTVEGVEFELALREQKRGVSPSSAQGDSPFPGYRALKLPSTGGKSDVAIASLEVAAGLQSHEQRVTHVRGLCEGDVPFAGCLTLCEGQGVPPHDLRAFGTPVDLEALALAVDAILSASSPRAGGEQYT
jgi:hypothetical protein